jgi:1-acyl-sn-glycerol-3-phosphate acyltransferase
MWYWILRDLVWVILKLFFGLKAEGLENLPKKNNYIIAGNHVSFLDPLIIEAVIPRKIHCLVLRSVYHKIWLRWYFKLKETVPTGSSSSQRAISLLRDNEVVGIFPEGRRSFDGALGEFKTGIALLALKTGRPIVPCAILGAFEAFPRTAKFPRLFIPVKVKIGKPIYLLTESDTIVDDVFLQEGILKVRNSIKEMLNAK